MVIIDNIKYSDDLKVCLGAADDKLKKVNIIEGCEEINSYAFSKNDYLEEICFPSTLKVIGKESFYGASAINRIDLSKTNVEVIKTSAFSYTNITDIKFPATLRSIEKKAFVETNITKLNLKNTNISFIGVLAFAEMENLKEVTFPKTLKEIGEGVFELDVALKKVNLEDTSITHLPRNMFNCCEKLKNVTLPDTLISVGSRVFPRSGITSLTFPKSMHTIPAEFLENSNITTLHMAGKLTTIGKNFIKEKLKTIHVFDTDKDNKYFLEYLQKEFKINIVIEDIEHLIDQNKSFKEINNTYKNFER